MPTKVTPLSKTGGGGGGVGTAGVGVGGASGAKTGGGKTSAPRPKLFDTSRFSIARSRLSAEARYDLDTVTQARGKGTLSALVFVVCVATLLVSLSIYLLYIGDKNYIVDVMVLGGMFLVMGVSTFVIGTLFVLRPILKDRRVRRRHAAQQQGQTPQGDRRLAGAGPSGVHISSLASSGRVQDAPHRGGYVNPSFAMDELAVSRPAPGTSGQSPDADVLYDRNSLQAVEVTRGKLAPPSPPLPAHPGKAGFSPRTGSPQLTTTEVDDVSEFDGIGLQITRFQENL